MLQTVLLIFHIFVAIALVGVIVIFQRSEGGGLGFGSSSGGSGSFMSARGSANFMTRLTGVLAAIFMINSLVLAILAGNHGQGTSILDQLPAGPAAPADAGKPVAPTPDVPLSK